MDEIQDVTYIQRISLRLDAVTPSSHAIHDAQYNHDHHGESYGYPYYLRYFVLQSFYLS